MRSSQEIQFEEKQKKFQGQEKKITKYINLFASKNSQILFCTIFIMFLFPVVIPMLIKSGYNIFNPLVLISHSFPFLLIPLLIIFENAKLKSFAVKKVQEISKHFLYLNKIFGTNNQIHPVVI